MAKMKPIIALIVPMYDPNLKPDHELPGPGSAGGEHPDNTLPGSQPHPDNTLPGELPHPEHPIFWPLPPGAPVDPDYGIDIDAPYPDQGLPGEQPHPDNELPGEQPRPDQGLPPFPSHPIVLPPGSGGWLPAFIWNRPHPDNSLPGDPKPDHELPVPVPPDIEVPPGLGISGTIKFKAIWTPDNGWQTIAVIIPGTSGEGRPIPTPSKAKRK